MTLEPSTAASPIRGIVFIIFAMLTFATMDGVSKFLVPDYAIAQLFLVRYLVYIFFALWVCRKIGPRRALGANPIEHAKVVDHRAVRYPAPPWRSNGFSWGRAS